MLALRDFSFHPLRHLIDYGNSERPGSVMLMSFKVFILYPPLRILTLLLIVAKKTYKKLTEIFSFFRAS